MKADAYGISYLKRDRAYVVPFFQRSYIWDEDNWEEFYDSIFEGIQNKKATFLGSILIKEIKEKIFDKTAFNLIDGQQRLTTISLFIKALIDEKIPLSNPNNRIFMSTLFLYENYTSSNKIPKIKHSHLDRVDYEYCLEFQGNINDIIGESKIIRCYRFFREKLCLIDDEVQLPKLVEFILNSEADEYKIVVVIELGKSENEQKIFDTVNSSGVKLTSADIIKNSLFDHLLILNPKEEEVINFYNQVWISTFLNNQETANYWNTEIVSGRIKRQRIEVLLHSVAIIEGIIDIQLHSMNELHSLYKDFLGSISSQQVLESFILKISEYANLFRDKFIDFDVGFQFSFNSRLDLFHKVLDVLDNSTFDPYILYLYYQNKKNMISDQDLLVKLLKVEKYIARTIICNSENKKTFNKNNADLINGEKGKSSITIDLLLSRNDIQDNVFIDSLKSMKNNNIATIVLFMIELQRIAQSNGKSSMGGLAYIYSLEHVMPQSYEKFWHPTVLPVYQNGILIPDIQQAKEIREASIYELGNLTLLTQKMNSSLSNKPFLIKKSGEKRGNKTIKGLMDYAQLSISSELTPLQVWSESEINQRNTLLTREILKIW